MNSLARLGIGLVFLTLWLGSARADEPAKTQFKTAQLDTLGKEGARFDWSKADFLEALKGAEGWELVSTSEQAALFRKTKDGPKWEYKSVKTKNSPFSTLGMRDTEAYGLILDRVAADGYTPCAVSSLGEYTLFKRVKDAKPGKAEFKTVVWAELIKSKNAPAELWKEKEFLETLNKQGTEGWEVCACTITAAIFQKSAVKWEYKVMKVSKSPLTFLGKGEDDEAAAFTLILEGLEAKEWKPCACGELGQQLLLKRELKAEPKPEPKPEK